MVDIKIVPLEKEHADSAGRLMLEQPREALKKGLPVPAFAAVADNMAVGAIAGAVAEGGVFEIHSLFVAPGYRRQGIGRALVEELSVLTDSMDLGLKAEYTLENSDQKTLAPFFEALDFMKDPVDCPMYCLGRLENLIINVNASRDMHNGIKSFFDLSETLLQAASLRSQRAGWPLPQGGLTSDKLDRDLSSCKVTGDRIRAYVVVEDMQEDMLRVSALWSELNDPREMMVMLSRTLERMRRRFRGSTRVAMLALNTMSYRIIEHVCPSVELCSFRYIRKD